MPSTIELLNREPVTYKEALNQTYNVIQRHEQLHAKRAFTAELWRQRDSIAALTSLHLRLASQDDVTVHPPEKWLSGSFNLCVPVDVKQGSVEKKLLMKCPMPFKVAEAKHPGSVDEKFRSEVGAYVWMQENCPSIRIPYLYGFGTSALHFTHVASRPWYSRLLNAIRRWIATKVYGTQPSRYLSASTTSTFSSHYMFLEFIGPETGQMVVHNWDDKLEDPICRKRLLTGMTKIILEMAKVPQPKIGSFRFNNDCTISLDSRAMFAATAILEGQGTPRTIAEGHTYTCTEPFVADLITFLDGNLTSDVSAADAETDCRSQMATRTFLRAVAHHFIKKEYRDGPFVMQLTDLNPGNFFVDDDWNITCLFDLEWVCALPPEALSAPYWVTGCSIDGLTGDALVKFDEVRQEFMEILREKEAGYTLTWPLASVMEEMWATSGVWFWHSLTSVDAAYWMISHHLSENFAVVMTTDVDKTMSRLWSADADNAVETKVREFEEYAKDVQRLFD